MHTERVTRTNARATAELARVTSRVLAALRFTQFAFLVYFVAVWHSWYGEDPVRLLGPAAMVTWIVAFVVLVDRNGLRSRLVAAEVVVAVVAAAGTYFVTPPASRGDGASWVGIGVLTTVVVVAVASSRLWYSVSLALLVVANIGGAWTHRPQVYTSTVLIVAIGVLIRLSYQRLSDVAFAADLWLAATFDRRTADAVADHRASDAREAERLIHDTVLNTLTGIGWGGLPDGSVVRSKCARSVAAVEGLLADPPPADGELGTTLRRTVALAGESGIDVELVVRDRRGGRLSTPVRRRLASAVRRAAYLAGVYARPVGGVGGVRVGGVGVGGVGERRRRRCGIDESPSVTTRLPAEVVTALAAAVGEVLTNVWRHAGTNQAKVVVELRDGRVVVAVADKGVGFDPEAAGRTKLGLRESVVGRVADVGGWVGRAVDAWRRDDGAPALDRSGHRAARPGRRRQPPDRLRRGCPTRGRHDRAVDAGAGAGSDAGVPGPGELTAARRRGVVGERGGGRRAGSRRAAAVVATGRGTGVVACGLALLVVSSFNVTVPQDVVRVVNWPLPLGAADADDAGGRLPADQGVDRRLPAAVGRRAGARSGPGGHRPA